MQRLRRMSVVDALAGGVFLADADTVLAAGRTTGYGSVLVKLASPDAFNAFSDWVSINPALEESAEPGPRQHVPSDGLLGGHHRNPSAPDANVGTKPR